MGVTYDDQDNATIGVPLERAWSDLMSMATKQIEVASFYWTLTAEDVNVNSSLDIPVECCIYFIMTVLELKNVCPTLNICLACFMSLDVGDARRMALLLL